MKRRNFFASLFGIPLVARVSKPVVKVQVATAVQDVTTHSRPVSHFTEDHLKQDEFGWKRWRIVKITSSNVCISERVEVLDETSQQALARYGP